MLQLKHIKTTPMVLMLLIPFASVLSADDTAAAELIDWSSKMQASLESRMSVKLQKIVLDAQNLHNLEIETRRLMSSTRPDAGCEPEAKVAAGPKVDGKA